MTDLMNTAKNNNDHEMRAVGQVLRDKTRPLKERFRALFTLRNVGGKTSVDCIIEAFDDQSALLKHELAYCLGQMRDGRAIPFLASVLKDRSQEPMVRHEAGEALGAIGTPDVMDILDEYRHDSVQEVSETCAIALRRVEWLLAGESDGGKRSHSFGSVDPAPASESIDVPALKMTLLDETTPMYERYRAMFALRNLNTTEAVLAIAEGLTCPGSALFRHEIAFVLGQLQNSAGVPRLQRCLEDGGENEMVRHECAEALGAVATTEAMEVLRRFLSDKKRVVRESCEVALDISEYELSGDFQYADALVKLGKCSEPTTD